MEAKDVIEIIIAVCSLVGVLGGLIPVGITLYNKIKEIIKNKDWNTICKMTMVAMSEAEEYAKAHPKMTGEEKLEMVLKTVKAGIVTAGIEVDDELIERLIAYINELCAWSKTVNVG